MTIEQQALDLVSQVEALKAQVNLLLKACRAYEDMTGEAHALDEADSIVMMTPEQCLNSVKADAIDEMCDKMPSSGFTKMRDQSNWIGDYIWDLRSNNESPG